MYSCSHSFVGYDLNANTVDGQSYHYIVESFKLSYAYRILLGDPAYNSSVSQVRQSACVVDSIHQCCCMPSDWRVSLYTVRLLTWPISALGRRLHAEQDGSR